MEILKIIGEFSDIFSITILVFGFFVTLLSKKHDHKNWLLAYLSCLLVMESLSLVTGVHLESYFPYLFIPFFFIQFLFLNHFYCSSVFQLSSTKRNTILGLGLIPFLTYLLPEPYRSFFQHYDQTPYSFTIMVYSLMYFYALINKNIAIIHARNVLNGAVLLFFTLDTFLAIGAKYLLTENLSLVTYLSFFRAIFLQLFYGTLIYYGWKSSKK
jgi:hypothetical protein